MEKRDFSIREEIDIIVQQHDFKVNTNDIYNEVEDNELMLDAITLTIYNAIHDSLEKQNLNTDLINKLIKDIKVHFLDRVLEEDVI